MAKREEAKSLAKRCDAVVVISDRSSANGNRLFEFAKSINDNTFFVSEISDLQSVMISKYNTLAIMAAASTPDELIEEVLSFMSDTQNEVLENATENTATEEVTEVATAAPEAGEMAAAADAPAQSAKTELTMDDIMASDKAAGFTTYREGKRIHAKSSTPTKTVFLSKSAERKTASSTSPKSTLTARTTPTISKRATLSKPLLSTKRATALT